MCVIGVDQIDSDSNQTVEMHSTWKILFWVNASNLRCTKLKRCELSGGGDVVGGIQIPKKVTSLSLNFVCSIRIYKNIKKIEWILFQIGLTQILILNPNSKILVTFKGSVSAVGGGDYGGWI